MTTTEQQVVDAVHRGENCDVHAEDWEKVRTALLVYAKQMWTRRRHDLCERATKEVERVDAAFGYTPNWRGKKGTGE